jgi:hypothetical protein
LTLAIAPALITAAGAIAAALGVQIFLLVSTHRQHREVLYGELIDLMRHLAANDSAIRALMERPMTAAQHHYQMLALPEQNLSISTSGTRFLTAAQISSFHRLALSARNYNFVVQGLIDKPAHRTPAVLDGLRARGRGLFIKSQKIADLAYPRRSRRFCKKCGTIGAEKCRTHFGRGEFKFPYVVSLLLDEPPIGSCPLALELWRTGAGTERLIDQIEPVPGNGPLAKLLASLGLRVDE